MRKGRKYYEQNFRRLLSVLIKQRDIEAINNMIPYYEKIDLVEKKKKDQSKGSILERRKILLDNICSAVGLKLKPSVNAFGSTVTSTEKEMEKIYKQLLHHKKRGKCG